MARRTVIANNTTVALRKMSRSRVLPRAYEDRASIVSVLPLIPR